MAGNLLGMRQKLLSDIEAFMSEHGFGEYRFGLLAAKNGRLLERLRAGKRVWPETEAEIRGFMISHRQQSRKRVSA